MHIINKHDTIKTSWLVFFKYFAFLFVETIKKRSIFLTWLTYLIFTFTSVFLVPMLAHINILDIWANTSFVFFQSLLNIVIAIFTAVLAINIIKFPNKDTTSLIVTAKPISRLNMILCRFLLFFAICIVINLTAAIITFLSSLVPEFDKQYILNFFYSMVLGNLINFGFYGAIAIIATLIFNKNTIILLNVILNIILFVWQTITLFAIKVPILQTLDNNIYPETISVMQREKDENNNFTSEYKIKQAVKFELPYSDESTSKFVKKPTNEGIKSYWQNLQDNDLNKKINVIDVGSQLTLTYNSLGLQKTLDQKAHKTFGISKFHDYTLASTASPEILTADENIDWLYTGEKTQNIIFPVYDNWLTFPDVVCFFGDVTSTVNNVIKKQTFVDFSIGTIWSSKSNQTSYVLFPSNKWEKYSVGFDEIYNNIFTNSANLKKTNKEDYYFTKSGDEVNWSSDVNIPKYYELVWYCLAKKPQDIISKDSWQGEKANQETFEIATIEDLNVRFIQFKHYVYWKLVTEQKNMFLHPDDKEAEFIKSIIEAKEKWKEECKEEEWKPIFDLDFQLNDEGKETWYVKCSSNPTTKAQTLFENGIQTPILELIKQAAREAGGTTYKKYNNQSLIYKNCVASKELHLFDNIDKFHRSNKLQGQHYIVQQQYIPLAGTYKGHNLGLFFYETKPRFDLSVFCLAWGLISLALYAIGFIVYQRYDIK